LQIPGAEKVERVFGRWPSFHDAEVIRFLLERSDPHEAGPSVVAAVHVFEMTNQVGPDGTYVLRHHTMVSLRFTGVDELQLEGFNNQNVLWDLVISDIRDRQLESLRYEVTFSSSFGMGARFLCREILVESAEPFGGRAQAAG
jgi:hypothetical protein